MAAQGLLQQHAPVGTHQAHLAEGLAQSQAEVVQLQEDLMRLHASARSICKVLKPSGMLEASSSPQNKYKAGSSLTCYSAHT